MRASLICIVVFLAVFIAYAYIRNPLGCNKVLDDTHSVLISLWPLALHPDAPPQTPAAAQPTATAPATVTAAPAPPTSPSSSPGKPWAPPDVMPAQPNWK